MAITKVSPDLLDLDAGITISVADNSDNLTLVSTDTDAGVGPNLNLYRNSGSPADSDVLGVVTFNGRNDNSQDVMYARQLSYITDASDGTEDGTFKLQTMVAGTIRDRLNITPSEINLNEDSIDTDFRVESNGNANAIFVNGGDNRVTFFNGTTVNAASGTEDGLSVYSDGRTDISRASAQPLNVRRRTDDGSLIQFYKEASGSVANVGNIGVDNGALEITATSAINLNDGSNEIGFGTAALAGNGSSNDAVIDLGRSNRRFKDLFLSGGAYLGGAVAANKLDDYEEGTWTITLAVNGFANSVTLSSSTGTYTKIGNIVYINCQLVLSGQTYPSGYVQITGIPFTSDYTNSSVGVYDGVNPAAGTQGGAVSGGANGLFWTPMDTTTTSTTWRCTIVLTTA